MSIVKEYQVDESVFVTKYVLQSLSEHYFQSYPEYIESKILDLILLLDKELEKNHLYRNYDILSLGLYERIEYEKFK